MKATLRTALLTLALAGGAAAGAETLDLANAIRLARERAPEIAAARARQEAGEARLRQARGHRRPTVTLEEVWLRTDSPAEAFALQLNQERFSFADFVAGDPNDPAALEAATTRLQLALPLYTGGELAGRIGQAERAAAAAAESAAWSEETAALAAAEAFIGVTRAREQVALLERALATAGEHVELARAYVEQGMLVASELLRARVEHARIEDQLAEARGLARVAGANLAFRLAAAPDTGWELAPLPAPAPLAEELAGWLDGAEARSDLAAANHLAAAAELEVAVGRSGRLPKVMLMARHDLVDDSPFGSHGDSTALMAVARVELWSGGRHRAAVAAARADAEAAATGIERFRDGIRLEIRDAFERAASARARHSTALAAQSAAAEAERITEERFRQGVVKMIDLVDASTARRETEMRELVARADAHLTALRLAVAAGRTPESALAVTPAETPDPSATESEPSGSRSPS